MARIQGPFLGFAIVHFHIQEGYAQAIKLTGYLTRIETSDNVHFPVALRATPFGNPRREAIPWNAATVLSRSCRPVWRLTGNRRRLVRASPRRGVCGEQSRGRNFCLYQSACSEASRVAQPDDFGGQKKIIPVIKARPIDGSNMLSARAACTNRRSLPCLPARP